MISPNLEEPGEFIDGIPAFILHHLQAATELSLQPPTSRRSSLKTAGDFRLISLHQEVMVLLFDLLEILERGGIHRPGSRLFSGHLRARQLWIGAHRCRDDRRDEDETHRS